MTASDNKTIPDFFDEKRMDPVSVATGRPASKSAVPKRKAGFYFSEALLDRFTRKFHQLKLDGVPVENKSVLAEMALHFALDDMDRGEASQLLKRLD
ncbi:hypothetical protein [Desulfosarcina sp.]|jgi:hypothetical protein|uniref:hypothetical protein n=1 Tax=Desulfosarcina sp. TaxID=2027861 RepID=UPI0029A74E44|nr:hypothetical protein [Desulfosarcina sp.]MDX2455022.1 hypothetical protein [Desulfosarcina sp.]MDX2492593.1 hypothetical protein [Desulfosarcina sp.]